VIRDTGFGRRPLTLSIQPSKLRRSLAARSPGVNILPPVAYNPPSTVPASSLQFRAPRLSWLVPLCGVGASMLAGCSTWTTDGQSNSSSTSPRFGASNTTASTASASGTSASATASGPSEAAALTTPPSVMARRPGKLDPFWIQTTAEADRAIWAASDPALSSTPIPGTAGSQPQAVSAGPIVQLAPRGGLSGDGVEGLTHVTFAPEGADFDPNIARDGSFMVFASTQHRPTADIYAKAINGRTITQLTSDPAHDIMPALSPDARRIAFTSNRNGNWDIFVMAAAGGQAAQITSDGSHELHPTWSPDGSKLAYSKLGQTSGRWEMWVLDMNSTGASEFVGYGMFPTWSPRSGTGAGGRDKIMFQRSRERGGRAFSIWTIDYKPGDVSSPTEIMGSPSAAFINAAWSPDGSRIVAASVDVVSGASISPDIDAPASSELWVCNLDGTSRINITNAGSFMNLMPEWAADGRIYFVSDRTGVPNIWALGTEKAMQAAAGASSPLQPFPTYAMPTQPPQPSQPMRAVAEAPVISLPPTTSVSAPTEAEPVEPAQP
jgi:TolB protein